MASLTGLLDDVPPFFSPGRVLWPSQRGALSSLQQEFFNRRLNLAEGLLREIQHEAHLLPLMSSTLARLTNAEQQRDASSMEQQNQVQQVSENNRDLLVTLDARGYAPGDITVKLEGRSVAVVAMKQASADQSHTTSSCSSSAAFSSSASSHVGFVQKIDLPAHLDLSGLSCSLMDDGQLRIHAPVAKQPISEERQVPIRFRTSLEFPITQDKMEDAD
ncbi:heat shock protein beta-9 [Sphaeramia orbicularis]|uniref:Alpha-crystallin A chain-like n=1 Tax=Sphaeramia orbicularis TaxID=375764 RepID=A0A672YCT0_9TELE|nr:alpha-crystallin A chain-like [Sphaeramia orbicularis]